ncbi:MAG TPA: outer membrane protein assembly factor BamD, partial [Saprospiraceae bacterium]|nr:outer membrane protein assembly factor BamD [Saprospiraceae bacterium]
PSVKAIEAFQDFANKYPESERVAECNKLIDELRGKLEEKSYAQGLLYYDLGQYQAAITSFETMLADFPESARMEEVRFLILKSSFEYAAKSVYDKRAERYEEAKTRYKEYVNRFPKGKHINDAKEINKQIESNTKNLSK